jgi:DNA-binding CsgD family transcriptional regulator/tetratricopeptide (TPR) repeat protein
VTFTGASRGGDGERPLLLERDLDLASIETLVDAATGGNGNFVVIEGSAGVGKTSLLAETRHIATGAGLRVLGARCSELEQEFAFGVVRQLFEPLLAAASSEERAELFAGAAELAGPLFDTASIAATKPVGDASFAMLHGLYWLAANAALSRPTAILVDDVHWCDGQSLRWMVHIARRLEGLPLMLVIGTRPPQQAAEGLLVTELIADPGAAVLSPSPLGAESVASLVLALLGSEPDERFSTACHQATGGNPLFLRALLMALAAEDVTPSAESAARVQAIGPKPVARIVSLRLSRLSPDAEALARAVAILDRTAELRLVAELAGVAPESAAGALSDLARAEIVRLEPRLEFTHPIIRTSIYERLDASERTIAHRRAAELLADAGAEPEQAAAHVLLVPPGGAGTMVSVLREAARRALVRGAATTAVAYLRRALDEPHPRELRAELVAELGIAERGVDVAAATTHLREAIDLTADVETQAELALECGRALYFGLQNEAARDVFTAASGRLGSRRADLRELLEAETMHVSWFEPELYPAARELLARVEPERLTGGEGSDLLLAALAYYEARLGTDRKQCIELAERALRSQTLEQGSSFGLYYALIAMAVAGQWQSASAVWDRVLSSARRRGDLLTTLSALTWRGFCALQRGELGNAESDVREGLELGEKTGFPPANVYTAAFLAEILIERGEYEEAESVLTAPGFGDQIPENVHFAFFLATRGRLRLAQRRPRQALADFDAIGQIAAKLDLGNPAYAAWRSGSAEALLALGDPAAARQFAAEELELARSWGEPRALGTSLRVAALADGGAKREPRLREAVEVLGSSAARLEHARALIDLGAALRRSNRRTDARELLRQGVELAHHCAATALAERGNEELAATGARPRKLLQIGPESLTASERRVARLAAEEMSNKEIAQALFVTVKTVEVHLSSVYRKLDVSSRREVASALAEPDLLAPATG